MNMKRGLGALALVSAAATAGAGWALQSADFDAPTSMDAATVQASTSQEAPMPSLSVLSWPRSAQDADDSTAVTPADEARNIDGLEAMSATGAAGKD